MLMGTDMVGDEGLRPGNSVSIYLQCDDVSEMRRYYESLSEGAIVRYPVVHNVWGT
jgi:PhnB protein